MNALLHLRMLLETAALGMIAKETAIVVLAGSATLVLPRLSAARRHLIWFAALVACAAICIASPLAPAVVVNIPVETVEPAFKGTLDRTRETRRSETGSPVVAHVSVPADVGRERPKSAIAVRADVLVWSRVKQIVFIAWIVGCLAILVRVMLRQLAIARLVKHSSRDVSREWAPSLQAAADGAGVHQVVRVLICPAADAPVTSGLVRPVILLPVDADGWQEERRRAVLVHELAHIARADYLTQLIGLFACALTWFHPLVWFALARLRAEAEGAADDRVLASGMPAIEYASHLLDLARCASLGSLNTVVAVGVVSTSRLERRFRALLDVTRPRTGVSPRLRAVAASVTLAVMVPVAGLRFATTPKLVPLPVSADPRMPVTPIAPRPASVPPVPTSTASATVTLESPRIEARVESPRCELPDSVAFRVQGNVAIAALRAAVGIVPGMPVTPRVLTRAIRELYATKTVDDHISIVCETMAGRSVLVFNVREHGLSDVGADSSMRAQSSEQATISAVPLDEIVATVDDQVITRFDVQERVRTRIQREELSAPTTPQATRMVEQQTLNGLIDEQLVLQKAKELKIVVSDSELAPIIDAQLRDVRRAYATQSDYERALIESGLGTPDEYRKFLMDQYRVYLTIDRTRSRLKRGDDDARGLLRR